MLPTNAQNSIRIAPPASKSIGLDGINYRVFQIPKPTHLWFRSTLLFFIAIAGLAQAATAQAVSGGNSLPQACKEALISNVQALGTVGIKFSVQRDYSTPGLPRAKRDDIYIYLDGGKFFQRRARTMPSPAGKNDQVTTEEMSFDGKIFYLGSSSKGNATLLTKMLGENPDDPQTVNTYIKCQYLDAIGYVFSQTVRQLKASTPASSAVMQLASEGKITSVSTEGTLLRLTLQIPEPYVVAAKALDLDELAKQRQQQLSSKPAEIEQYIAAYRRVRSLDWIRNVELWLDMDKGYALTRRKDTNPDGRLIQTIECEDFKHTEHGNLWLPQHCTVKTYVKLPELLNVFTDKPNETDRIKLQEITFQPQKDISFKLVYGTGTLVTDRSTKEAKASKFGGLSHMVPADNESIRKAAINARSGYWKAAFFTGNIVVLLILVILISFRIRKRGKLAKS
jgi:hypothetical protein